MRRRRLALGLTVVELARLVDVSRATIGAIERGQETSSAIVGRLADRLGCRLVDELYERPSPLPCPVKSTARRERTLFDGQE